jgi:uncharacterized protein YjbI with pentapeptide repeats
MQPITVSADFVPLAGWVLALVTFAAGTVVPVVYRRFSFDEISLQQAHDVRVVTESDARLLIFSTVLKVANVGGGAVVLDHIRAPEALSIDGLELRWIGTELKLHSPGAPITLPPSDGDGGPDYLPVVIGSPDERILALGFRFSYPPGASPATRLSRHIERHGLAAGFRINGKYRDYTLKIGGHSVEALPGGASHREDSTMARLPAASARQSARDDPQGAKLAGRDLRGASLREADLRNADLEKSDLRGAVLTGANLQAAILVEADLQGAVLDGANLHGCNLTRADLRGAVLGATDLREANLARADLRGAVFSEADLGEADLARADLRGAVFDDADLREADLADTRCSGAVLTRATLRRANLTRAELGDADMANADLLRAVLKGASLNGANLGATDLRWAVFEDSDARGANFAGSDFHGTVLHGSDLREADLSGADLVGAHLETSDLRGAVYSADTRWPSGQDPDADGAVRDRASIDGRPEPE